MSEYFTRFIVIFFFWICVYTKGKLKGYLCVHNFFLLFVLGLLVKDPQKRISFESFFSHPFVNLLRPVSSRGGTTADELILQAKNAEKEKVTIHFSSFVLFTDAYLKVY